MVKDLQNQQNIQKHNWDEQNNGQDEVLATLLSLHNIKPRVL